MNTKPLSPPPPHTHIVYSRRGRPRHVYDLAEPHIYHGPGGTFKVKIQTSRIPYFYRTFKTIEVARAALARVKGKPVGEKKKRSIRKKSR